MPEREVAYFYSFPPESGVNWISKYADRSEIVATARESNKNRANPGRKDVAILWLDLHGGHTNGGLCRRPRCADLMFDFISRIHRILKRFVPIVIMGKGQHVRNTPKDEIQKLGERATRGGIVRACALAANTLPVRG